MVLEFFKELFTEVGQHLLGELKFSQYIAGMIFAGIGQYLMMYYHARIKRDVLSPATPKKFSNRFLILDNLQRLLFGVIICFISFRFAPMLMEGEFSFAKALALGVTWDNVALWLRNLESKSRIKIQEVNNKNLLNDFHNPKDDVPV